MPENVWISIKISLKFVPKGPIDKIPHFGSGNGLATKHYLNQCWPSSPTRIWGGMSWLSSDLPWLQFYILAFLKLFILILCMQKHQDWCANLSFYLTLWKATWNSRHINSILMKTSSKRNILPVAGPLWRKFTGHQWIPLIKASDAELWCFYLRLNEQSSKPPRRCWFEMPSCSLSRHCDVWSVPYI